MRNHFDNVNGAAALTYAGATMAGWTINDWAAAAALTYSLILIASKLWQLWRWLRPRGK